MRQVEVAAVMNMLDSHGLSNSSVRGSTSSVSSSHLAGNGMSGGGGRPSYQLSDTPSGRSSKPQQEIVTSNKKPETFADMVGPLLTLLYSNFTDFVDFSFI